MHPVSSAQFDAAKNKQIPPAELIAEDLWSVAMPLPGSYLGYTLAAVSAPLGGSATVVDPGWGSGDAMGRLAHFFTSVGRRIEDLGTIVITHAHPDHFGLVTTLQKATGASLAMHQREQTSFDAERIDPLYGKAQLVEWGVPPSRVDALAVELESATGGTFPDLRAERLLGDGDVLSMGGRELIVVATPGHTAGHICLADLAEGLLFAGDHILPNVFPGVGIGVSIDSNAVEDYLASLARTAVFDGFEVIPGHGYRFRGVAERGSATAEKILSRASEVAAVLSHDPDGSIVEIASRLSWRAGWQTLFESVMLSTALHQTGIYREFVMSGGLERHRMR